MRTNRTYPDPPRLVLLTVRRALGVSVALYAFYIALHYLSGYPFLAPADVLLILGLVFAGTAFGVAFSFASPLLADRGIPRVVRTALLTIPAFGIGVVLQVVIEGARSDMAIYAIFALAAWLGSTFVRESDESDGGDGEEERERNRGRDPADDDLDCAPA